MSSVGAPWYIHINDTDSCDLLTFAVFIFYQHYSTYIDTQVSVLRHVPRWKRSGPLSALKESKIHGNTFQEPNLENNMAQERMTRRIKQLEEEKLFAEMQASKELDKRRKTPEQKGVTSTTILEEENTTLKEQVRELKKQIQLLMTSSQERGAASSAESSAEWQKLAGKKQ